MYNVYLNLHVKDNYDESNRQLGTRFTVPEILTLVYFPMNGKM